ncbi:MAG: hypothetical protein AB3N18_15040 [Allomuricauda sp.]
MEDIKSFLKLVLLLLVGWSQLMYAQEKQSFQGSLTVGRFEGLAEYTYFLQGADTILDGDFNMRRSNLNALLKNTDDFFSFKGSFQDGYPEGNWTFQFGTFKSGSETEVVGYQYRVRVNGTQTETQGNMVQGKPDGVWTYEIKEIEDSEVKQTLFASTLEFDNGVPQKSFKIESEHNSMVGRFLRNGLAHDVWTLYSDEDSNISESWYFNEGFLEKMEYGLADGSIVTKSLESTSSQTKVIDLDDRFFSLLQINQQELDMTIAEKKGIQQLLLANMEHYKELDALLSALGKSEFKPGFKVKVAYYPLDSLENAQLNSISARYAQAKEISHSLLENTQLNILRRSDNEAQFLYEVVSKISETFLNAIGELIGYQNQGVLEFMSREQLFNNTLPEGFPSKTILVSVGERDETYVGPKADEFDFSENDMTSLHQLAEYAALSLESIAVRLNQKLLKDSKQQEFIALEEQLIAHSNHIGQVVDSVKQALSKSEKAALQSIQDLAERQLEQYATMENEKGKVEFGNRVMNCLKQLDGLAKTVSLQPERWNTVEEKYRDDVWNPFMATIMNEEVKKRITNAYGNVLVPYLLDEVTLKLSCDNAKELQQLFDGSYERMLQMRDENTSKLERKLKKAQDPKTVLQLFNLKSSENQ